MNIKKGTLDIVAGWSFLNPSGIQLVMRDTPRPAVVQCSFWLTMRSSRLRCAFEPFG
ncbi:hypothetical protein SBA3_4260003 [Candidatus Sulfopaludibacter sp. SbA3]|nr:hypothetical protein SBA3_4260003 [Candidatus Sulfopaludibacter sp. SbA3]